MFAYWDAGIAPGNLMGFQNEVTNRNYTLGMTQFPEKLLIESGLCWEIGNVVPDCHSCVQKELRPGMAEMVRAGSPCRLGSAQEVEARRSQGKSIKPDAKDTVPTLAIRLSLGGDPKTFRLGHRQAADH